MIVIFLVLVAIRWPMVVMVKGLLLLGDCCIAG